MTREELIQELIVQLIQIEGKSGDMNYIRGVADFILSRQKLLLEKIGKVLREVSNVLDNELGDTDPDFPEDFTDEEIAEEDPVFYACMMVNEALAIIEKEGGE